MSFADSVRTCLQKYAVFQGRASRPEYWWFWLFNFVISVVLYALLLSTKSVAVYLVLVVVELALLLPGLGAGVRRLHDTNRSGWWVLIGLVPIVGAIILIVFLAQPGAQGDNRYGAAPTP